MTFTLFSRANRLRNISKANRLSNVFRKPVKMDWRAAFDNLDMGDSRIEKYHPALGYPGTLHVHRTLDGTWRNDTITINQLDSFHGHKTLNSLQIDAKGGRDTIIINHQNAGEDGLEAIPGSFLNSYESLLIWNGLERGVQNLGMVHMRGGPGKDTFIAKGTGVTAVPVSIKDMEVGEKLITHRSNTNFRNSRGNMWTVEIDGRDASQLSRHFLDLPDNTRLEQMFNAEGDAIYMCVQDF